MKKVIKILGLLLVVILVLTGCSNKENNSKKESKVEGNVFQSTTNFIFFHFMPSNNIYPNCILFWDAIFACHSFFDFIRTTHHTKAKKIRVIYPVLKKGKLLLFLFVPPFNIIDFLFSDFITVFFVKFVT